MKKIYAPWRGDYITNDARTKSENIAPEECVFCTQFAANDDDCYFILRRFEHTAIMLNLYPYNSGHLLILPLDHHAKLGDLGANVRNELFAVTSACTDVLQEALKPHGFNVGMNLGKGAGAGIPAHMHMHIVPRWEGDTNFMPIIADTKAVSFDLRKTFDTLKPLFADLAVTVS